MTGKRATVHDLARAAGVSLATIDRVLNGRPGVRSATVARVEQAIAEIGFARDLSASLMARGRDLRLVFLIPQGRNPFMDQLAAAVVARRPAAHAERVALDVTRLPALDADALARAIDRLAPAQCDAAVVVATSAPAVEAAIAKAQERGIPVLTLVSDLPEAPRRAFIGVDNLAAGRSAASLLGRFCRTGTIGVIAGSLALRDHRLRAQGFAAVLADEYPGIDLLGPFEAHDDPGETEALAERLLGGQRPLAGLYNLGAGNAGLIAALRRASHRPSTIVHELTPDTRAALADGVIDVVIDQNPEGEVRAAIETARALIAGKPAPSTPIGMAIFLRDNLG